ncbi:MAG: hypothetical protein ACOYLC_14880, partial [Armatimonadaceae bacterium]
MRAALGRGEVSQCIHRVGDDTFIRNESGEHKLFAKRGPAQRPAPTQRFVAESGTQANHASTPALKTLFHHPKASTTAKVYA